MCTGESLRAAGGSGEKRHESVCKPLYFSQGICMFAGLADDVDPVLPGAVFMCSVERCDHTILCVEINYALEGGKYDQLLCLSDSPDHRLSHL